MELQQAYQNMMALIEEQAAGAVSLETFAAIQGDFQHKVRGTRAYTSRLGVQQSSTDVPCGAFFMNGLYNVVNDVGLQPAR